MIRRIIIHWTGCGYYYAYESGQQLSKMYKTKWRLEKFAKISFNKETNWVCW